MFVKFTCHSVLLSALPYSRGIALMALVLGMPAIAQDQRAAIPAKTEHSAYLQDGGGLIVRSGDGLCWRNGYWTEDDAVAGCDGPIVPPVGKMIAPPLTTAPAPAITAETGPAAIPTRPVAAPCEFSVTLEGDQAFAFNSAELSAAARRQLEQDVMPRLSQCRGSTAIRITGHTDRLGSASYNRRLSLRRAQAVARHLDQLGVKANLEIVGAGASQTQQKCEEPNKRKDLLGCLAPDRRVLIQVRGTQN